MTDDQPALLARSREELEASRLLHERGFDAQAVSRAYYAAFYAASEALLTLGETRSRHSGVVATFIHLVVKEGGMREEIGKALRSLFDRRSAADYGDLAPTEEEAAETLELATRVVDAVEEWLTRH